MKRTISVMVGKGSVNHNSRKFHAKNTDPERSDRNIEYCNEDIREVYHELFDEAQRRFNDKQKRKDRIIDNYYEKICSGKQEKTFHEVILQIGNRDDCNATSEDGDKAARVLDEYMKNFQERNPSLRVFSAHLHMDEATPHLHIDFVPFTTESKRGLDTRVSLKQALADMGFKGGSRSETEWNQWVSSEKQQLAQIMQQYGIEWEQKGTHEKHLSVLDYEKKERAKEVRKLEKQKERLENRNAEIEEVSEKMLDELAGIKDEVTTALEEKDSLEEEAEKLRAKATDATTKWEKMKGNMSQVRQYAPQYTRSPEEWLPNVKSFESAKSYRSRIMPVLNSVASLILKLYSQLISAENKHETLKRRNNSLERQVGSLSDRCEEYEQINQKLYAKGLNFDRVQSVIGEKAVEEAILKAKNMEKLEEIQKKQNRRRYMQYER